MDNGLVKMSRFLDACEEVEQRAADLYHLLVEQFAVSGGPNQLWRKTALKKENHARHVKLAKLMVKDIIEVNLDAWRSISRLSEEIYALFRQYSAVPPALVGALGTAIEFEEKMAKFHMQNAITLKEKAGNDLFAALMKADRNHVKELRSELKKQLATCQPMLMAG